MFNKSWRRAAVMTCAFFFKGLTYDISVGQLKKNNYISIMFYVLKNTKNIQQNILLFVFMLIVKVCQLFTNISPLQSCEIPMPQTWLFLI